MSISVYCAIYHVILVVLMSSPVISPSTLSTLRRSISKLGSNDRRLLFVQVVFQPGQGYYIEEIRLDEFESYQHGEIRRKSVFQSGLLITSRMATKYYKTTESMNTDLARLFSVDNVPDCIDLRIINWSEAFPDALVDPEPDGSG